MKVESKYPIRAMTHGPKAHIKSYYDMQPWSLSGKLLLCMESEFQDRPPTADDSLTIGVVHPEKGDFEPVTKTRAWNFQQGCMLHWMPSAPDKEIIYNDRIENAFRSVVMDIQSGNKRVLPLPVQALTPDGKSAATLNFARWAFWRPGYGYEGITDPFAIDPRADEDAVHLMDLQTGEARRLVTLKDVAALTSDHDFRKHSYRWFNHLMFNTDGSRLIGLVRWWTDHHELPVKARRHCMWCINTDGSDLRIVSPDALISHAEWKNPDEILYFGNRDAEKEFNDYHYWLINVITGDGKPISERYLRDDGHMSYHRNRRWLVSDTYPNRETSTRALFLFDCREDRIVPIHDFYSQPHLVKELRCDLHPCWSRDYTQIAVDSNCDGIRQVYVVEVGDEKNWA